MQRFLIIAIASLLVLGCPAGGWASGPPSAQALSQLPPALRAAVLTGHASAIERAIQTLSRGDSLLAANLAASIVQVARQMLQTNPTAACVSAAVAVSTVRSRALWQNSPQQSNLVLNGAASIAQVVGHNLNLGSQSAKIQLINATITLAQAMNKPAVAAAVAAQIPYR